MQAAEQLRVKQEAQELNLNNIIASEGTEYRLLVLRFPWVADSAGIFSFYFSGLRMPCENSPGT